MTGPLAISNFASTKGAQSKDQVLLDPAQQQLENKRQISQMYQYYNYLIFEKNKESFNEINPDLRKMTYKFDNEVKNGYMTVQASPEVIQAAMGMNMKNQKQVPGSPGFHGVAMDKDQVLNQSIQAQQQFDKLKLESRQTSFSTENSKTTTKKVQKYKVDHFLAVLEKLKASNDLVFPDQLNLCPLANLKFLDSICNEKPATFLESKLINQENMDSRQDQKV